MLKFAITVLFLIVFTSTCGGGGNDVTGVKTSSCDSSFNTSWHWTFQTCANGLPSGISPGQLSTTNGCRLTLDVTPDVVKASGGTYTMIVAFDQGTATVERKGTVCDAIDSGKITERNGHEYAIQFRATPTGGKCCEGDYFANISF